LSDSTISDAAFLLSAGSPRKDRRLGKPLIAASQKLGENETAFAAFSFRELQPMNKNTNGGASHMIPNIRRRAAATEVGPAWQRNTTAKTETLTFTRRSRPDR